MKYYINLLHNYINNKKILKLYKVKNINNKVKYWFNNTNNIIYFKYCYDIIQTILIIFYSRVNFKKNI